MFTFRYKNRHFLRYYFESQNPTFRRTGRILSGKAAGMIPTATGRIGKPLVSISTELRRYGQGIHLRF